MNVLNKIWPWSEIKRLKGVVTAQDKAIDKMERDSQIWEAAWVDLNQSHIELKKHREALKADIVRINESREVLQRKFDSTSKYLRGLQVEIYAAQKNDSRDAKGRFTKKVEND